MNIKKPVKKIYDSKIKCRRINQKYNPPTNQKSKSKILLIGHNCDRQGAQILLEHIAKECVRQGWETTLLVRNPGEMLKRYAKICPTECFLGKKDFEKVVKKYHARGYKSAICNTTVNGDLIPILKRQGYKVETLVHELPKAIEQSHIEDRAVIIAEQSDMVVFPSGYVHKKFEKYKKVNRYFIRPQGLYLTGNHDYNYEKSLCEIKRELNIENNKIVINVAAGILRKGFDIFLRIAQDMESEKDITFVWIGDYDSDIYNEVLGKKKLNNLILYGYIDNSEHLAQFYDCAKILMLTSREEPFGSIVLEAFHSGTPVIGFQEAGGFVDTVLPGKTGELVAFENATELKKILLELLSDEERLKKYSENCIAFSKEFQFDKYVQKITEIFYE